MHVNVHMDARGRARGSANKRVFSHHMVPSDLRIRLCTNEAEGCAFNLRVDEKFHQSISEKLLSASLYASVLV